MQAQGGRGAYLQPCLMCRRDDEGITYLPKVAQDAPVQPAWHPRSDAFWYTSPSVENSIMTCMEVERARPRPMHAKAAAAPTTVPVTRETHAEADRQLPAPLMLMLAGMHTWTAGRGAAAGAGAPLGAAAGATGAAGLTSGRPAQQTGSSPAPAWPGMHHCSTQPASQPQPPRGPGRHATTNPWCKLLQQRLTLHSSDGRRRCCSRSGTGR